MKVKKVAAKPNKKANNQAKNNKTKKAAPAKAAAKKPLKVNKKSTTKKATAKKSSSATAKPKAKVIKASVKPVTKKAAAFSLKSAASKFKNALTKKTAPTKAAPNKVVSAAKKSAVAQPVRTASTSAVKAVSAQVAPKSVQLPMPKGMLTEDRIRKMSDKEYMNDSQLNFFRYRLIQMRNEVLARELDVKERLHQREVFADPADRATAEEEHWLDLRLRERESLLLRKIDDAIRRIADREFGYCEKTGDPIGIPRLLARPTATVCVDIKGQDERIESQFRDR